MKKKETLAENSIGQVQRYLRLKLSLSNVNRIFLLSTVVNAGRIWVAKESKAMGRRGVMSIRRGQEFYCQADNRWGVLPSSRYHDSWVLREGCRRVIHSLLFLSIRGFISFSLSCLVKSGEYIVFYLRLRKSSQRSTWTLFRSGYSFACVLRRHYKGVEF